ncbi:MAG: polyphenol oxidase family protein [Aquificae bacterium]|nr:polyphenol oxidase family protein [Aquificota bacterium]
MRHLKIKNLNIIITEKSDGNMKDPDTREDFLKKTGLPVYIPHQKHTAVITTPEENLSPADGVFIERKVFAGGVLTADCMPVVITDFNKLVVIHAGWRGAVGGIIQRGIELFEKPEELTVFIGPSAGKCCYQVQNDFIEMFREKGLPDKYFYRNSGGITFSMQEFVKDITDRYGIKNLIDISLCTICEDDFYSYRKGDFSERILTLAWLEE